MIRTLSRFNTCLILLHKRSFLTDAYKCCEAWKSRLSSPVLSKVNLDDFYNQLDQTFTSQGVISAVDVDVFANSINDSFYLDELRDLLYKLRSSADTGNMLDSTHHATIRSYIDFGNQQDLFDILRDPLRYGVFLDEFSSNYLLSKFLKSEEYNKAATIASLVMLQEEYSNEILCMLSQYACYKYITGNSGKTEQPETQDSKDIEEVKIRIKFLRNPYFDDHFDIKDPILLAGKTLAWISEGFEDSHHVNIQIIGWLYYKKYEKLKQTVENCRNLKNVKVYIETLELIKKEKSKDTLDQEQVKFFDNCLVTLNNLPTYDTKIEDAFKVFIENAINKQQNKDIKRQEELYQEWSNIRKEKLEEQILRLDRAKRVQLIEEKQKQLNKEEQKLWFFENEENIDLEIENKKTKDVSREKGSARNEGDDYIPPEIRPKRV